MHKNIIYEIKVSYIMYFRGKYIVKRAERNIIYTIHTDWELVIHKLLHKGLTLFRQNVLLF